MSIVSSFPSASVIALLPFGDGASGRNGGPALGNVVMVCVAQPWRPSTVSSRCADTHCPLPCKSRECSPPLVLWRSMCNSGYLSSPKEYIHRVGRTARGLNGRGHALLILRPEELGFLRYLKQSKVKIFAWKIFSWEQIALVGPRLPVQTAVSSISRCVQGVMSHCSARRTMGKVHS